MFMKDMTSREPRVEVAEATFWGSRGIPLVSHEHAEIVSQDATRGRNRCQMSTLLLCWMLPSTPQTSMKNIKGRLRAAKSYGTCSPVTLPSRSVDGAAAEVPWSP